MIREPDAFVVEWLDAWNAHDVERVLAHFHDDITFTSPVAATVLARSTGVLRGKAAVRERQGCSAARRRFGSGRA